MANPAAGAAPAASYRPRRWPPPPRAGGGSDSGAGAVCLRAGRRWRVAGVGVGRPRPLIVGEEAGVVGGGSDGEGKQLRCGGATTVWGCSEGRRRQQGWGEAAGIGDAEAVWGSNGYGGLGFGRENERGGERGSIGTG